MENNGLPHPPRGVGAGEMIGASLRRRRQTKQANYDVAIRVWQARKMKVLLLELPPCGRSENPLEVFRARLSERVSYNGPVSKLWIKVAGVAYER